MELTKDEKIIQENAKQFIKENKERLISEFILHKNPLCIGFATFFMAGSPGAGKTEFSNRYMSNNIDRNDKKLTKFLKEIDIDIKNVGCLFIRIDVDEIRKFLPQYQKTDVEKGIKGNAHIIQGAANDGLDILRDYCLNNKISFLHDGTFGNYKTLEKLIKRSLKDGRIVQIFYVYLDPITAWDFTKKREYLEGRNIIKDKFIEQFFNARKNVDEIKQKFGGKVQIHCVLKNEKNKVKKIDFNVASVADFLKVEYSKDNIKEFSKEDLRTIIN